MLPQSRLNTAGCALERYRRKFRQTQSTLNKNMNTLIKRIAVLLFVTATLIFAGVGCNTAHGFGKDMEKAGEKIQRGTD